MYILLILTALMFATPMLFTLLSSIKTKVEIFAKPFSWPEVPQWSNYVEAWTSANMSHYFLNSLIQAGATVIVLADVSTMAPTYCPDLILNATNFYCYSLCWE